MEWLVKLFGDVGMVRFEGLTINGEKIKGKVHVEMFNCDRNDLERHLKNALYVERDIKIKEFTTIGFLRD